MHRVGYLTTKIAEITNLQLAFYKAQRHKQDRPDIIEYRERLDENLQLLHNQILSGKIKVGEYREFKIFDPKERVISASEFSERVLHHAIMNICEPYFEKQFIFHTYANRKGKGEYAAIESARKFMRQYKYVAKLDVRKYFDSINHNILQTQLNKIFKDRYLLNLFNQIINSYHVEENCGLPIGNLTSQYMANLYLSPLDHFIGGGYVRYMDDILVFADTREKINEKVINIENYLRRNLMLELKSPIIHITSQNTDYLGYRLSCSRVLLNRRSKRRFSSKYQMYKLLFEDGIWSEEEYSLHLRPLFAFVQKAYTKKLRKKIHDNNAG